MMFAVVAVLFVALRPLENNPLSGWDGAPTITSTWRGTAVGVLLCVAGVATLAAIRWGLKDDGLICVGTMVTALVTARMLAEPREPHVDTAGPRSHVSPIAGQPQSVSARRASSIMKST
jgi:hypothetical protein